MTEKRKVVVLSRYWPTGLSIIRSLGEAGYAVDYVASSPKKDDYSIAAVSCYVNKSVESVCRSVKQGDDPDLLNNLLNYSNEVNNGADDRIVLFPTDDYAVSFAERHRSELEKYFIMPGVKGGDIVSLMDKVVQGELARKAGLRTPAEWIVSLRDEITVPTDMMYPCFCKPLESITGYKGEMKKCEDRKELESHLDFLKTRNAERSVIVQEFLNIDNEIDLSGVCTANEVIIPAIIRKTAIAEHEKGVTMAGYLAPFEELDEFGAGIIRLMKSTGYVGMFDLEINEVNGELYFGEINFRSGGPNYAYFLGGINLPELAVRAICGEKLSRNENKIIYGKPFVYEKVAYKEYLDGYLSKAELNRICDGAAGLISSSSDTRPTELFRAEFEKKKKTADRKKLKSAIKRRIYPGLKKVMSVVGRYPQCRNVGEKDKPKTALVVGRNYCSNLCMARALGMAGYKVKVLRIYNKKPRRDDAMAHIIPEAYSRYVSGFYTVVQSGKSRRVADAILELADADTKLPVFPTEDVAAYIIDEYYDELKNKFLLPNINDRQAEIIRLMSKDVQKVLAAEAGLPLIPGRLVRIRAGQYELGSEMSFPCFIKPDVSRTSGKGRMKRCENREELERALDSIAAERDMDVIVEDFIDIKREIAVLGICCGDKAWNSACFEMAESGKGSRRGVSISGRTVDATELESVLEKIRVFMESLNYTGLYDVDLIESNDGNRYFVELNLRYGASGYVLTESGVNLPGMLADYMSGREIVNNLGEICIGEDAVGRSFASEKVLIEEFAEGYIDKAAVDRAMADADVHFIMNSEDEEPYRHFRKFFSKVSNRR